MNNIKILQEESYDNNVLNKLKVNLLQKRFMMCIFKELMKNRFIVLQIFQSRIKWNLKFQEKLIYAYKIMNKKVIKYGKEYMRKFYNQVMKIRNNKNSKNEFKNIVYR